MSFRRRVLCCFAILLVGLAACGEDPAPNSQRTSTPEASPSVSPSPSASPLPAVASPTPSPPPPAAAPKPPPPPPPAPVAAPAGDYTFPMSPASVARYGRSHHDYPATDIFAPCGTPAVAVTGGVIQEVIRTDEWSSANDNPAIRGGLSYSMVGDDGVRYYGSHLAPWPRTSIPGPGWRRAGQSEPWGTPATPEGPVAICTSACRRPAGPATGRSAGALSTPGPTWTRGVRAAGGHRPMRSRPGMPETTLAKPSNPNGLAEFSGIDTH